MTPTREAAGSRDCRTYACGRHLGEHRRVHRFIRDNALRRAPPPGLFLDVGSGDSEMAALMEAAGYDALRADLSLGQGLGLRADMARLPLADASARVIAYCASLHYTGDTARALVEAARVLDEGGVVLVALTPVNDTQGAAAQGAATTARRMSRNAGSRSTPVSYRHLVALELDEAIRASGLDLAIHDRSGGLSSPTRSWRDLKGRLLGKEYARFPLLVLKKNEGPQRSPPYNDGSNFDKP